MEVKPPIRCIHSRGNGLIVAMSSDESEYTVRLENGSIIKLDGQGRAEVYQDKHGFLIKFLPQ